MWVTLEIFIAYGSIHGRQHAFAGELWVLPGERGAPQVDTDTAHHSHLSKLYAGASLVVVPPRHDALFIRSSLHVLEYPTHSQEAVGHEDVYQIKDDKLDRVEGERMNMGLKSKVGFRLGRKVRMLMRADGRTGRGAGGWKVGEGGAVGGLADGWEDVSQ